MKQRDFIINFSEEYNVLHLDDIDSGCITNHIVGDIFLVKKGDIHDIQEGILNG